jgi:hypothetical protein
MDTERIERALRAGPPDEPVYTPGAFRAPVSRRWQLVMAGLATASVLVVGIAVGMGIQALRSDGSGRGPDGGVTSAQLEATWVSDEIAWQDWVDGLVARGFTEGDLGEFLRHDPFEEVVQYRLEFDAGRLTIRASYDRGPILTLSAGDYTLEDSVLRYVEDAGDAPLLGDPCAFTAQLGLDDQARLAMDLLDTGDCSLDSRIAHTAFFELSPLTKSTRP